MNIFQSITDTITRLLYFDCDNAKEILQSKLCLVCDISPCSRAHLSGDGKWQAREEKRHRAQLVAILRRFIISTPVDWPVKNKDARIRVFKRSHETNI